MKFYIHSKDALWQIMAIDEFIDLNQNVSVTFADLKLLTVESYKVLTSASFVLIISVQ